MNIIVNEKKLEFEVDNISISEIIEKLQIPTNGIAIAVGSSVVPKSKWETFCLEEGSKVTIIRATQGG